MPSFRLEPFRPSRPWRNPHAQTIIANTLRSMDGILFRRVRLALPDGDFLDVDFPTVPGVEMPPDAPLVLLLHGLEGSARSSYACETYRQLARRGIRSVGMNYRSCSGEMNRTPRLYHAGATDDVAFVVAWLEKQFPGVPKGLIGFSLGGNLLLKYLGEQGTRTPVRVATAVSPPFDLARGVLDFDGGSGRLYANRFLKDLKRKAQAHPFVGRKVDMARVLNARTVRDFDDAFTAPLHGFRDAQEYYTQNSCGRFLPAIRVPTLILRAEDDPFFARDIPYETINAQPCLFSGITRRGGHVGFAEGRNPWHMRYWAERQAARFLAARLGQ